MDCWKVILGGREINKVYFSRGISREVVKNTLIHHRGFHPQIVVSKSDY